MIRLERATVTRNRNASMGMTFHLSWLFLTLAASGCWELPPFDSNAQDTASDSDSMPSSSDKMSCPDNQCLITGSITEDQHWTANNRYLLRGTVQLGNGETAVRLTIDPGTHISGERDTTGTLVITRYARLLAEGTAEAPIVFSSDRSTDDRRRGDWGGIIINGNAPINGCEKTSPCELYDENGTGWYGGEDTTDDSGVLSYVRIEYGGRQLGPSQDHGGLFLRGVGSGTIINHVHTHLNDNDGISVYGGSVDLRHILSTGSADNGFSWTGGWQGRAQYIVVQQYEDVGENGIEASNHIERHRDTPVSAPVIYNMSLIGVPTESRTDIGLLLHEGTRGEIGNSLLVGFSGACLDIDHPDTWDQTDNGELRLHGSIVDCETTFMKNAEETDPEGVSVADFFYENKNNHATQAQLTSPFSREEPEFSPALGSPAIGGAVTPEDSFFEGTNVIGGVDPSDDWTQEKWIVDGIAGRSGNENDDPFNVDENSLECTGEVCIASGTFTTDMRWTADKRYILRGGVFIGNGEEETTLIIDPGTEIAGESATTGFLVIQRNAKLFAEGTAESPIVFTSDKPEGQRARGDWGGVIINGKAPINGCDAKICETWGEGGTGWYGGTEPDDSSGAVHYVRIEFAGKQLGPDNELNGLALQGVGSGTELSYLHLHMNKDDAIEFFGGTVNVKYVLATGTGDDNLDWTQGWQGRAQFFVAQQYWDDGDNGIEADNNSDNNAEPFSDPIVANFTLIGVPNADTSDLGVLLREGTRGTLVNGIVIGFEDACLDVDHLRTWQHADDGRLTLSGVLLDCVSPFNENESEVDPQDASLEDFFTGGEDNAIANPGIDDPFERETPSFAPEENSLAAKGALTIQDAFITRVDFKGGVNPSDDWIAKGISSGWIRLLAL